MLPSVLPKYRTPSEKRKVCREILDRLQSAFLDAWNNVHTGQHDFGATWVWDCERLQRPASEGGQY